MPKNKILDLRKKAEEKIIKDLDGFKMVTHSEIEHELYVHKIELEMQNEELLSTQLKLEQSLENIKALFEFAPAGNFVLDFKGNIININDTGSKQLGLNKNLVIKKPFSNFLGNTISQDEYYKHRMSLIDTGKQEQIECIIKRNDGSVFPALITSSIIKDKNDQFKFFLTMVNDITIRKKEKTAFIELHEFSKHLLKTNDLNQAFIAKIIHDEIGQQIITTIMGLDWLNLKIDLEDTVIKEKINELLEILRQSNQEINKLIDYMHPSILDNIGLYDAIESYLFAFQKSNGINYTVNVPKSNPELSSDLKISVYRIFVDSLVNIVKHTEVKKIVVSIEKTKNNLTLLVNGNGLGFDNTDSKIQDSFEILKIKERTLGIGGDFYIRCEKGKGIGIRVSIPLYN
jgi:PAS domain S-box-containing protein